MATAHRDEQFKHAIIDLKDMTISEIHDFDLRVYSLTEFLRRWDGVPGVTLTISCDDILPQDGRDAD